MHLDSALPILCMALLGCGDGGRAAPEPLAPDASILLLTIDSLRFEHVGVGGSERDTTPTLDRLAEEGVFFERCYAQSAWTLPSMVSLLTAMTPAELGIEEGAYWDPATGTWIAGGIAPEIETLTEILARNGFHTAGFSSSPHLTAKQGFQQGFDEFDDASLQLKGAEPVFHAALSWLDRAPEERFFLWAHLFDPHFEQWGAPPRYDVPLGYEELFPAADGETAEQETKRRYDAKVRAMDDRIGDFLRALEKRGALDDLILVVAIDHGEEFNEDGRWGHSRSVRDSLVRVPLWIRLPGKRFAGTVVSSLVQNMDTGKTLLDLVGIPPHPEMEGASLVPLFDGSEERPAYPEGPVYGETKRQGADFSYWLDPERRRKLVIDRLNEAVALYDLESDPDERHDLSAQEPQTVAAVERALHDFLEERKPFARSRTELSDEAVEAMRGMGYVGDE